VDENLNEINPKYLILSLCQNHCVRGIRMPLEVKLFWRPIYQKNLQKQQTAGGNFNGK